MSISIRRAGFLIDQEYSDLFFVEEFNTCVESLTKRGFEVVDARDILNHDLKSYEKVEGQFANISGYEISSLMNSGKVPSHE
jgi:hypothetical protein